MSRTPTLPRDVPPGRSIGFPQGRAERMDLDALVEQIRRLSVKAARANRSTNLIIRDDDTIAEEVGDITFTGNVEVTHNADGTVEVEILGDGGAPDQATFTERFSAPLVAMENSQDESTEESQVVVDLTDYEEFSLSLMNVNTGGGSYFLEYWNGSTWIDMMPSDHLDASTTLVTAIRTDWLPIPVGAQIDGVVVRANKTGAGSSTDISNVTAFFRKEWIVSAAAGENLPTAITAGAIPYWTGTAWDAGIIVTDETNGVLLAADGSVLITEDV